MTAATTMSTVRQRLVPMLFPPGGYQEKTHAMPVSRTWRGWRSRTPCAGITQIRCEGLRHRCRTLSAVRSPVGYLVVALTLTLGSTDMQISVRGLTFDV